MPGLRLPPRLLRGFRVAVVWSDMVLQSAGEKTPGLELGKSRCGVWGKGQGGFHTTWRGRARVPRDPATERGKHHSLAIPAV